MDRGLSQVSWYRGLVITAGQIDSKLRPSIFKFILGGLTAVYRFVPLSVKLRIPQHLKNSVKKRFQPKIKIKRKINKDHWRLSLDRKIEEANMLLVEGRFADHKTLCQELLADPLLAKEPLFLKFAKYSFETVSHFEKLDALIEKVKGYANVREKSEPPLLLGKRIAVYTAIAGGYDVPKLPSVIDDRIDYFVFSDREVPTYGIWRFRPLSFFNDPVKTARFVKTHPHIFLSDYDIFIWVDANVCLSGNLFEILKDFIESEAQLSFFPHPHRSNVYEEAEACISLGKDDQATILRQIDKYRMTKFVHDNLGETGVLLLKSTNETKQFLNFWWSEIITGSKRDQLSFNYCIKQADLKYASLAQRPINVRSHPIFGLIPHGLDAVLGRELNSVLSQAGFSPQKEEQSFYSNRLINIERQKERSVDTVVCVHNSPEVVRECLASIERARSSEVHKLIIVDDGSHQETKQMLNAFAEDKSWVKIINNPVCLGYTKSANIGLRSSKADFIVLLNSDTVVTRNWIEKLCHVAYSAEDIGIVGPLSNAASHQSIPDVKGSKNQTAVNSLPSNLGPEDLNLLCEQWSFDSLYPRVFLIHGFCFGLKREVLEKVGYLDEVNFPRGYGEENDFCLRAMARAFTLAVATNTYIFHHKSKSFESEERVKLMKNGRQALISLHSKEKIVEAIRSTEENPLLERIRNCYNTQILE